MLRVLIERFNGGKIIQSIKMSIELSFSLPVYRCQLCLNFQRFSSVSFSIKRCKLLFSFHESWQLKVRVYLVNNMKLNYIAKRCLSEPSKKDTKLRRIGSNHHRSPRVGGWDVIQHAVWFTFNNISVAHIQSCCSLSWGPKFKASQI